MASQRNGTLYTGVTNNLVRRVHEHKEKLVRGFTSWYNVNRLVYYESYDTPYQAITREKQLKFWKRDWKIVLIEEKNPYWDDLYPGLLG